MTLQAFMAGEPASGSQQQSPYMPAPHLIALLARGGRAADQHFHECRAFVANVDAVNLLLLLKLWGERTISGTPERLSLQSHTGCPFVMDGGPEGSKQTCIWCLGAERGGSIRYPGRWPYAPGRQQPTSESHELYKQKCYSRTGC